jgi:hypothetical protein
MSKRSLPKSYYTAQPWQCQHAKDSSAITAYVEASGTWETVATIHTTSGNGAETLATFICNLINDTQKNKSLLQEAMDALQLCLEEDRLTFSSEQAVDHAVARIRSKIP